MSILGIKNWLLYRRRRPWLDVDISHINSLEHDQVRLYITNILLEPHGLVVVDEDKDIVPKGVYLTPAQKAAIDLVAECGYHKIGFKNAKTTKKNAGPDPSSRESVKCY